MPIPSHIEGLVAAIDGHLAQRTLPAFNSPTDDDEDSLEFISLVPFYSRLPESFSLADLLATAVELDHTGRTLTSLVLILVWLNDDRPETDASRVVNQKCCKDYVDDLSALRRYVADVIAPISKVVGDQDEDLEDYDEVVQRTLQRARYGLGALQQLELDLQEKEVLLTLMSFAATSYADQPARGVQDKFPWTTRGLAVQAKEMLTPVGDEYLLEQVLKDYLRDMFSKSKPRTVTASGRKTEYPDEDDPHRGLQDETSKSKPWKYVDHRAIAVFQYVVLHVDRSIIIQERGLFVPVLLALIEDGDPRIRASGLFILNEFLKKSSGENMRRSGLIGVFKTAIFSSLHILPNSTTSQDESAKILEPAFLALQTLSPMVEEENKLKFLDEILRDGIFPAYSLTKAYHLRIAMILANQVNWILPRLKIHAVKYLKDLLPQHCELLTDPFAELADPADLWGVIDSLEWIIQTCWPRLSRNDYQDQIINAIVVCFLRTYKKEPVPDYDFKSKLSNVASMVTKVVSYAGDGGKLKGNIASLVAQEPKLAELFKDVWSPCN